MFLQVIFFIQKVEPIQMKGSKFPFLPSFLFLFLLFFAQVWRTHFALHSFDPPSFSFPLFDFDLSCFMPCHAMPCHACVYVHVCTYGAMSRDVYHTAGHLLPWIVRESTMLSAIHSVTTPLYLIYQPTMILYSAIDMPWLHSIRLNMTLYDLCRFDLILYDIITRYLIWCDTVQ